MSELTDKQRDELARGLLCSCGHDVGGEHNSLGCYARISYEPLVKCDCKATDDQDPLDALAPVVARMLADARAEALRDQARQFREEAAEMWGGPRSWFTSGNAVADLVAGWCEESAAEHEEQQ